MSSDPGPVPRPTGSGAAALERIAGLTVERWIAGSDDRAVAIGRRDGARLLVAVVPLAAGAGDGWARPGREPWDLPLLEVRDLGGGLAAIDEALAAGVPSTAWARDLGPGGSLPPFAAQFAREVAATHAGGGVVGRVHPALVFVTEDGALAGVAQRLLQAPLAPRAEGRTPLFATGYLTPADLRGTGDAAADDVFRLAAMAWAWRHGAPPFGSGMAEAVGVLGGLPATDPADALDRLLVAAFDPDPAARPSAVALADAFSAASAAT